MTERQMTVLKQIVNALRENGVAFQITGGLAAICHGASRPLYDLDVKVGAPDIYRVMRLFAPFVIQPFRHHQSRCFDIHLMILRIECVPIDIVQAEDFYVVADDGRRIAIDNDLSKSETIEYYGMVLPVEPKNQLLAYKRIINRPADQTDIKMILAS